MTTDQATLGLLAKLIAAGEVEPASSLLDAEKGLARLRFLVGATREAAVAYFLTEIKHYCYAGDTALHIAAAAYQTEIARKLIGLDAEVGAGNRRGAQPLHYAADGFPGSHAWNPAAQAATIALLIEQGADPNTCDRSGVTPLHRAVRNRCAEAVRALIEKGADVRLKNRNGSSPLLLATHPTGRGGAGSRQAKAQQAVIVEILESALERAGP